MPRRGSELPLSSSSSSSQDDSKNKSCCKCGCWLWILAIVGVAGLAGGLTWYLLPEESKKDLPSLPGLSGGDTKAPTSSSSSPLSPTTAPTVVPWRFHQCQDNDNDNNCCQGLDVDGMCNMRVNEILYGYMHNAVHTVEDDFLFPWNHEFGLEKALEAGYRALELDVGRCDDEVVFYHSLCGLGTRNPTQVLQAIGEFVAQNPTEIVILLLQMPDDVNDVSLTQFDDILQTVPAVTNRLYAHGLVGTPWPTLQQLLDADQRVILFYKNQPNCRPQQTCPRGAWHYWNEYAVETEWEFFSVDQFDDTEYSCAPNRGDTVQPRDFYRVNAFVSLPSPSVSATLNDYAYAQARMEACSEIQGQEATFYAVDYWDQGDVLPLVQDVNRQRVEAAKAQQQAAVGGQGGA